MRLRILLFMMVSAVWPRQCLAQQSHQTAGLPPVQGEMSDDSLRMWADKVASYARKTPQEIVSVHMDNTCYFLGDTIWYKAYVVREGKMIPSDISGVLYAELFNQDGYLVERQTLRLQEGQAHGSFCIPDTAYAGYYELRAYTRWQLNWGVNEYPHPKATNRWFLNKDMAREFYRNYDKLYSRVFPVYDKPEEAGKYSQVMTLRPLRRYYKLKKEQPTAEVTFFPEGGNWVSGVEQRVAFEALSEKGESLEGRLIITDSHNQIVGTFNTEHRGRGLLNISTQPGEQYHAEFHWGENLSCKVDLPKQVSEGMSIFVKEELHGLEVRASRAGLQGIPLGMTVLQNGAVRYQCQLDKDIVTIPRACLDAGIAQVTIYDRTGRMWADRLVFCCQDKVETCNVDVSGMSTMLNPYEQISLKVKAAAGSRVSVAVRDRTHSGTTYDNGSLLTDVLLSSQIKGFVEDPGYYFEASDSLHRRHLDLLLMVQGWRRHEWREMTQPFRMQEPFEVSPILRGDVFRYTPLNQEDVLYTLPVQDMSFFSNLFPTGGSCGPKIEEIRRHVNSTTGGASLESVLGGTSYAVASMTDEQEEKEETKQNVVTTSGQKMQSDKQKALDAGFYSTAMEGGDPADSQFVDRLRSEVMVRAELSVISNQASSKYAELNTETHGGQFALQLPHSDTPYYLHLQAVKKGRKPTMVYDSDEYPDYSVRISQPFPRFVNPYSYYQVHLPDSVFDSSLAEDDSSTWIGEVTVGARRGGLRSLDLNKPALVTDAYQAYNEVVDAGLMPAWLCGSLFFSLNLGRLYIGDMGIMRSYDLERRWNGHSASFFTSAKEQLRYNHLRNLEKVLIYTDYSPRLKGDPRYMGANQPGVTVNMVALPDDRERPTNRDRLYVMNGYNVCEEFYHPHYEQRPLPSHADYRRTLYWNPNLKLDANGEATITLWGNSRECQPVVSVEGITSRGEILTGSSR
ncbi:MAG: hypothetical protein ACI4B5_06500 [Bacteroidaceae bacterium]